jgi:Fic family protein
MSSYPIKPLQQYGDIETTAVLKALVKAHKSLGELKGLALSMPNQNILLSTLSLQEAKESSAIENIITTQDDLYQSNYQAKEFTSTDAKEVHRYAKALEVGYELISTTGLLTNSTIIKVQQTIENNTAGFRTQAGTTLINDKTKEVIYTPPQTKEEVLSLMSELENFINIDELANYDVLVKMAMIHHQFESIHPFYDGNGRTGRIINILYLTKKNILGTPILYLSRFINQNKDEYYNLLQTVRDDEDWEAWLLYILKALDETAQDTSRIIQSIIILMQEYKVIIKDKLPQIYSHELINNLFSHPYTKNEFIVDELGIHRNTARRYLDGLVEIGLLEKQKVGTQNFYINKKLYQLLS